MQGEKEIMVPYIVYEGEMARAERRQKRNFILIIILVAALLLSNFGWLYAWMQYDYSDADEVITVDGGERGIANYIGNDGEITNGADYGQEADTDKD